MPAITTFKRPVDAPQGWSLTPARMLEAADLSVDWRSQGRPEFQSRARAVHQMRTIEEQSPHGPFLRTLEVTSAKMPVELFHEVLLVQNLIFHWTEDEDALAKSVWPQASPEEIEEPVNASVGARAVTLLTAESIQACAKSPPLTGPSTVGSLSPELSPELSRPVVEAPPLAEPSLKVNLKRRRAEPESTARKEEPMSSGRGQNNKDREPIVRPQYGITPALTANKNPEPTAVPNYGILPSNIPPSSKKHKPSMSAVSPAFHGLPPPPKPYMPASSLPFYGLPLRPRSTYSAPRSSPNFTLGLTSPPKRK